MAASPSISGITITDPGGEGDGHVERGEPAYITFTVDGNGASIDRIEVALDGESIARFDNAGTRAEEYVDTGALAEGVHRLNITAALGDGKTLAKSTTFYVSRNYDGWIRVENTEGGSPAFYVAGVAEIKGSMPDGNWIYLTGGREIEAPYLTLSFDGGMVANRTLQCLGMLGRQNGSVPINYVFGENRYPVFYVDGMQSTVHGSIDLSKDYDKMDVGVGLIRMSMTERDPVLYADQIFQKLGTLTTDGNGDVALPSIEGLEPDLYLLIIYDPAIPDGVGLLAVAPFYVVDYTPTVELSFADKNMANKTVLNPGDNLMVKMSLPMAGEGRYLYTAFAVPESDYTGTIGMTSTGTISDMRLDVNAFTTQFDVNYDWTLRNASANVGWAQNFVKNSLKSSNMSAAAGKGAGIGLELPLRIGDNAMAGKYYLVTAVLDQETSRVVAVGQSTFTVSAAEPGMGFNLTLLLIAVLFVVVLVFVTVAVYMITRR